MNVALKIALIKKLIATITALIALLSAHPVKLGGIGDLATTTAQVAIVEVPCIVIGQQGVNYFEDLVTHKISTTTSTEAEYDALDTPNPTNPTKAGAKWLYSSKAQICQ